MEFIARVLCVFIVFAMGGMLTTLLSRIRRDYPHHILKPFAHCFCDHCGKKIKGTDTLPVIGYLLLRGKTRCCSKDIPIRYLSLELCSIGVNLFLLFSLRSFAIACYLAVCIFSCALLLGFAVYFHGPAKIKILNFIESVLFIFLINAVLPLMLLI